MLTNSPDKISLSGVIDLVVSDHGLIYCLSIHWRFSTILKTSNKSVQSNVFWYVKVCILWKCIQYTIHWDKTQILNKFHLDKINGTKMPSFFFRELQLITVLLLNCDSYMSWSTRFVSLKPCGVFSISDSFSFLLKIVFLFNKIYGLVDLRHNSFQN